MSFRQHLELMPRCLIHCFEDLQDEVLRHVLVEEVAHGIDKDAFRLFPAQRQVNSISPKPKVKALLVWVSGHAAEALSKRFSVTVSATWTDFCTTGDRIPSSIRPFYV